MSNASSTGKRRPKTAKERRKGWIVIGLVGFLTLLFFVLGTIDPSTRYDMIGL